MERESKDYGKCEYCGLPVFIRLQRHVTVDLGNKTITIYKHLHSAARGPFHPICAEKHGLETLGLDKQDTAWEAVVTYDNY